MCFSGLHVPTGGNWETFFLRLRGEKANAKVFIALLDHAYFESIPCMMELHAAVKAKVEIVLVRMEEDMPPRKENQWKGEMKTEDDQLARMKARDRAGRNAIPHPGTLLTAPKTFGEILRIVRKSCKCDAPTRDSISEHGSSSSKQAAQSAQVKTNKTAPPPAPNLALPLLAPPSAPLVCVTGGGQSLPLLVFLICFPCCLLVANHNKHFHVALADAEGSRRSEGQEGDRVGAAPPLPDTHTCLGLQSCVGPISSSPGVLFDPLFFSSLRLDVCTLVAVCLPCLHLATGKKQRSIAFRRSSSGESGASLSPPTPHHLSSPPPLFPHSTHHKHAHHYLVFSGPRNPSPYRGVGLVACLPSVGRRPSLSLSLPSPNKKHCRCVWFTSRLNIPRSLFVGPWVFGLVSVLGLLGGVSFRLGSSWVCSLPSRVFGCVFPSRLWVFWVFLCVWSLCDHVGWVLGLCAVWWSGGVGVGGGSVSFVEALGLRLRSFSLSLSLSLLSLSSLSLSSSPAPSSNFNSPTPTPTTPPHHPPPHKKK